MCHAPHFESHAMSPENCTGYLCRRTSPTGTCVTSIPHPCSDGVLNQRPPKSVPRPKKAFVPPLRRQTANLSIQEEDSEEETMDYESDPEQDESEEVRQHAFVQRRGNTRYICPRGCQTECSHRGILHVHVDCECPASGKLHWHEGEQSGRQSSNQSNHLRQGSQGKN